MKEIIEKHIAEHQAVFGELTHLIPQIEGVASTLVDALKNGKTIFWCGNGGSASDSQHLAGELIGRFVGNRVPLRSIALTAGGAEGSCIANDFGYDQIFSRQVEGLGVNGDVLIGITTSGNSQNILNAFNVANDKSMKTVGLLGKGGGQAASLVQQSVIIPSDTTARIQEMHITIGHILCDLIEEGLNLKA
ncbi:MAG: SIS domain-containing protein [Methylophilaceae bacterium]|nr:SIS domain-containing protein [Methylophilaceae bacterium]